MITGDLELSSTGDILISNGDVNILLADDLVRQLSIIMLRSQIGEWKLFPDLGFGLRDFVKEPNSEELAQDMQDRMYTYISLNSAFDGYTPIIDVYPVDKDELRIDFSLTNPNKVEMDIGINFNLLHGIYLDVDEYDIFSHSIYISETIKRVEKRIIKESTNIITLQFYPDPDFTVRIYDYDSFNGVQDDNEYTETIVPSSDVLSTRTIDFKTDSNFYNDIVQNGYIVTKIVINEDWEIDVVKLMSNNWVYKFDDDLLWNDVVTNNINLIVYWIECFTVGKLINIKNRAVNDESISPENEDCRIYTINTAKTLTPGIYIIEYFSLKTIS